MKTTNKNQSGFAHLEIILLAVIVGIIGSTGWYVLRARSAADKLYAPSTSTTPSFTSKKMTSTTPQATNAPLQATGANTTPSNATSTPAKVTKSTTAATTTIPPATQSSTPPTTNSTPPYSVSVDSGGCYVNAVADVNGYSVIVGAYQGHHGGDHTYTLTASNGLTEATGGQVGWTAYGNIIDGNGTVVASASAPVTSSDCLPPNF